MAKNKVVRISEEEYAALKLLRQNAKAGPEEPAPLQEEKQVLPSAVAEAQKALADAFVEAIERTKPPIKHTVATLKPITPWTPRNGEPREKMKRRFFHHGLIIEDKVSNEEIRLLNKLKPGSYCEGWVRVSLRKDRGIDIDYPVRTAVQRLKLVNKYGVRSFTELLKRIIDERENPKLYTAPADRDLYDLED